MSVAERRVAANFVGGAAECDCSAVVCCMGGAEWLVWKSNYCVQIHGVLRVVQKGARDSEQ